MNALDVLCAQLKSDLFAIAKFLLHVISIKRLFINFEKKNVKKYSRPLSSGPSYKQTENAVISR